MSRYLRGLHRRPEARQDWLTFLRNHREVIAAMDLFVVCTVTFRLLYVLFVIRHGRRQIVHFNVTERPTAAWVVQQIREAFPYDTAPRYLIFDRDSIFSAQVVGAVKAIGAKPTRTSYRAPWQNGTAERWIGSARRELLDHLIVLDEGHLRHMLREYVRHHHDDRTHLGRAKETPSERTVERRRVIRANRGPRDRRKRVFGAPPVPRGGSRWTHPQARRPRDCAGLRPGTTGAMRRGRSSSTAATTATERRIGPCV